ncbi:MAG TPA: MaoC family dehydratase [Dehalococcoidia bacterium]|nr:MaoC family dehydratase [Dehalococcoidia bacterium]
MAKPILGLQEPGFKFVNPQPLMVTGNDIDMFCNASGMREDIFLSDESAKAMGMKARVAPGPLHLALMLGCLVKEDLLVDCVYLGTDKMKVLHPLYPGDSIRAELEMRSTKPTSKGDMIIFNYSWALKNQNDETTAQGENTCAVMKTARTVHGFQSRGM